MAYTLIFDKQFARDYRKLDKSLQIEGDKKLKRLKDNPKDIGKPLKFLPKLYELHLQSYRIYYIFDDMNNKVLVLAISYKDEQDKFLRRLSVETLKRFIEENL
ncbi:MAG: type II toxin-antitoxin system RelE/ParE family toxin [Nanoarchaeota archaeon]